ncbi:unnamed protein product [Caenorhabditis nigoni]
MNEAEIKKEVIEEEFNFTFKNGGYVEVKEEEIEQKPEYLLGKYIKTEPIDVFESNNSGDEFFEDVKLKTKEKKKKLRRLPQKIEVSREVGTYPCQICQKTIPRNLLKLVMSEDNKIVLSEVFKVKRCIETIPIYVCSSHIQKIIDDNDGKLQSPKTPSEKRLRTFIKRNKLSMKHWTQQRHTCQVCYMLEDGSKLCLMCSKGMRIVVMVGCILRGTHSIDQAKSYIVNRRGETCYSHRKESIDKIFENLGVGSIEEFLKCPTLAMDNLMEIVKSFDLNFTVEHFVHAFHGLFLKKRREFE